ncbi:carbohydrate kinase family protein [Saccharopolyspora sp. MS10]|uniref:carbohydrate kinase family protein n=1 Tax=Saccharopolyspora sp. MS10 TaxID=3385973 RepID=UPI0039A2367D
MIVIGGEALVDLVPDSATEGGELGPLHPRLGGGPYNVAIALGRLDVPAGFLATLSTDQFGDKLLERMVESGVSTDLVSRSSEPTTLAVVGLSEDRSARYSFHTEGTAARFVNDPGPLGEDVLAVSFGTLGMVLEPGATVYETVLFREAERGMFVALDPNIRADLIADPAAYRKRFESWLPAVDLLKLSVEDAEWLAGDEELDVVLRRWQQAGPAGLVLTRGADGLAALIGDGELVEVPGVRAEVADTIGAGDTVHAALLAWLHDHGGLSPEAVRGLTNEQWREALDFAARAAAITVSRPGAEPPTTAEIG